jgi:long-subunit fatty acid transport protein
MNRQLFLFLTLFLLTFPLVDAWAQSTSQSLSEKNGIEFAPINTAVPSLTIAPDAHGGSMGDNGIATPPDVNAQFWNPSKNAFQYSQAGVSLSYTPWLRSLVSDVALACLSGYYKIGDNDLQAIGGSLRYFTLGEVQDSRSGVPTMVYPYEMALDINYSRKLTEEFAMGVALRFIRSDMGLRDDLMVPGNAYAADVSGYGERYIVLGASESLWSYGFNISNIGTKISYDGGTNNQFLPASLRIGTGILYPLDEYNRIGFYLDLSKYLVPSEPLLDMYDGDDEAFALAGDEYRNTGSINGIFRSFSDSPGGLSGELKEIMASVGVEYTYDDRFFLRGGYYYENENMGNRLFFSAGAGFRMNVFQLDVAYLIANVSSNPLDRTLRLSLSFDMDGIKALFR